MRSIQEFLANRKNKKTEKKSAAAYELMKGQERYTTSDTFMIRLNGDVEDFKPFLERIRVEGYEYRIDTIDGELFSPTIIYVRIIKPNANNYFRKD